MFHLIIDICTSFFKGVMLGSSVCILGYYLDYNYCIKSQTKLINDKPKQFIEAHYYITTNLLVITPTIYVFVDNLFLEKKWMFNFYKYLAILLTHNLCYFFIHKEMHRNSKLKYIHKFHHEFDDVLTPSIGNAVTHSEFLIAYVFPFVFSAYLYKPTEITFIVAVGTISLLNIVIHTIELKDVIWIPGFVSPKKHIIHHKERNKHYSAPLLDLDEVSEKINDFVIIS